jgi:hypothetical protein
MIGVLVKDDLLSSRDPAGQLVDGGQERAEVGGVTCQQIPVPAPVRRGLPRLAGMCAWPPPARHDQGAIGAANSSMSGASLNRCAARPSATTQI